MKPTTKGASKPIKSLIQDLLEAKEIIDKLVKELQEKEQKYNELLSQLKEYKKTAEYVKVANYLEEKGLAPKDVIRMIREGQIDDETFHKYAELSKVDINVISAPHEHVERSKPINIFASEAKQREFIRMSNLMSRITDLLHQP